MNEDSNTFRRVAECKKLQQRFENLRNNKEINYEFVYSHRDMEFLVVWVFRIKFTKYVGSHFVSNIITDKQIETFIKEAEEDYDLKLKLSSETHSQTSSASLNRDECSAQDKPQQSI